MTPEIREGADRLRTAAAAVLLALLALALYQPWSARPFEIYDFSEFLPLLTGPHSFWGRFDALTRHYAGEHGRLNIFSYAGLAAKWSLFGASPRLWQCARALEMALIVAGVYFLFRRLALGRLPALAGASLFLFSGWVGEAWTRMTMGEPLGLLAALGALLLATTWRTAARPLRQVAAVGALMALAVLAKEMLIGILPLVWLVGLARRPDGRLGTPDLTGQARLWLVGSSLPALAALGAAFHVARGADSSGFTHLYGTAPSDLHGLVVLVAGPWLPQAAEPGLAAFARPGNACFALLTLGGFWLAWRKGDQRPHLEWALLLALGLSLTYALLYAPWPQSYLYYAIPFALGPAYLFGIALQAIGAEERRGALGAFIGWGLLVLLTAPSTGEIASQAIAMQRVNGDLVHTIGRIPNADRLVVARVDPPLQPWMGAAATLRRYALATGGAPSFPAVTQDLGCAEGGSLLQQPLGRTLFVSYQRSCGGIGGASAHLASHYHALRVDWSGIRWTADSAAADLLVERAAWSPPVSAGSVRGPAPRTD
jgi:hypothetical protein